MEAICIANKHTEILFFSRFQPDIQKKFFNEFLSKVTACTRNAKPLLVCHGMEFVYIFQDDMFWCCCLNSKSFLSKIGTLFVIENLNEFYKICAAFLGTITQHSITSNVVLLQEIIIETMCGGYMQTHSVDKLRSQILSQVNLPKETAIQNISSGLFGIEKSAPTTASQQSLLSIESQKKEIFVDIVEKVWATVSGEGTLLRAEVSGSIILHCFLLNSPLLCLSLNSDLSTAPREGWFSPQIQLSEVDFGQDVDTSQLETKRELRAVAKPGETVLLRYTLPPSAPHVLPFGLVESHKQSTHSDVELKLKLSSTTGMGTVSPKVKVTIVAPPSTKGIMSRTNGPKDQVVSFDTSEKLITWTITNFPGGSYAQSFIRLVDAGGSAVTESAVVEFEVSKWVSSGLRVESVRLEPKTLKADKWVRYLTTSDTVIFKFNT